MDRLRDLLRETWRMALAAGVMEAPIIAAIPCFVRMDRILSTQSQCKLRNLR
jgi:hypothetical protein